MNLELKIENLNVVCKKCIYYEEETENVKIIMLYGANFCKLENRWMSYNGNLNPSFFIPEKCPYILEHCLVND
jgi:hypothetical protein